MHQLLMLGGRGMHQRTQMRLQQMLILSKLVLQRTNSLQGLELMRQSLLRLLHLLFRRLLCALRLQSHQLMMLELGDNSTRRLTDTDTLQSELSNCPNTKKK